MKNLLNNNFLWCETTLLERLTDSPIFNYFKHGKLSRASRSNFRGVTQKIFNSNKDTIRKIKILLERRLNISTTVVFI